MPWKETNVLDQRTLCCEKIGCEKYHPMICHSRKLGTFALI
jgi:hypothetical protein